MWSNISTSSSPARASLEQEIDDEGVYRYHEQQNGQQQQCKPRYGSPLVRYKHAVCVAQASGYIYIHGGRFGNLPLDDDVWRFDPHQNSWIQLKTSGCKPPSLQEHTLIEYGDQLYLFGGQISASGQENSFWCLNLANNQWRSLSMKSSSRYGAYLGPTNRRGHTAVLYGNSMFIYGGFEDFRGSSAQLWEYDLLNERWELRNLSATSSSHPEPRHSHSAIVHQDAMYIYGGLSNLKPLADLWRWSWRDRRWFRERTRGNSPGQLHGHTAIQAFGSMFVFGGERNGRTTRGLWRLNLSNMTWQKIRAKGPRPNPTTWHGAIANPLCILDEANYIIEGDPELILKDVPNDNCCQMSISYNDHAQQESSQQQQASILAHSKSSNGAESLATAAAAARDRSTKQTRKSRLSFLRTNKTRNSDKSKSIYELRQIRTSLSANNFGGSKREVNHSANRHSATLARRDCDHNTKRKNIDAATTSMVCEPSQETNNNVGILDSLDTDIKEMFERAMSPAHDDGNKKNDDEMPMSVELSSRSNYVTAPLAAGGPRLGTESQQTINSSMNNQLRSQRTSYAYTTPPPEMSTLRDESDSRIHQANRRKLQHDSRALLASGQAPEPSGYDKRDNRPRSEIVQSLIDRADARIKHLYTPYFNNNQQQQPNHHQRNQQPSVDKLFVRRRHNDSSEQRQARRGQSFLDKTKRHTIHQTMTYYNLYYNNSEESSKSSGERDSSSSSPKEEQVDTSRVVGGELDDFGSSSTMKEEQPRAVVKLEADQLSLVLDTNTHNSSETRTLCQQDHTGSSSQYQATSDEQPLDTNSFPNALTARRDTTSAESTGDNTSLSFSVIAEFEEDDMFSSPVTVQTHPRPNLVLGRQSPLETKPFDAPASNRVETILFAEPEDQLQTMILTDHQTGSATQARGQPELEDHDEPGLQPHNKSTSSGYDSIASRGGHDTPSQEASHNNQHQHHAESSIRTTESDSSGMVGGMSSSTTIDTTASPEQSAIKKLRAKYQPNSVTSNQRQQEPVLSADSLADIMTSPSISSAAENPSPKNVSSCAQSEQLATDGATTAAKQTHRKMPLMSRSRFFGRSSSKSRYWQLCMFVIGGKQGQGSQGVNEPITVWRLYI